MAAPAKDDIQKELDELDKRIANLKILYDKYFLGMEKFEPQKERGDINKIVIDLQTRFLRNTAAKFRRDQLKSKFLSYARFWDRILKQIEEGTYRGHRVKAELHERERLGREKAAANGNGADLPESTVPEGSVPPGRAPAAPTPAAAAAAPPSGSRPAADPIQKIFDQYVAAKKKANENVEGLSRDKMAAIITQQTTALKAKYNCKSVEFRVVVEDGKAKLKAIPK